MDTLHAPARRDSSYAYAGPEVLRQPIEAALRPADIVVGAIAGRALAADPSILQWDTVKTGRNLPDGPSLAGLIADPVSANAGQKTIRL